MRRTALLASLLLSASCTLLRDFDGFDTGSASPTSTDADVSMQDGGGDGGDDDAGGDGNLRPNGDFEDGCAGWSVFKATLTASSVARSGQGACRVCPESAGVNFSAGSGLVLLPDPPVGSEYRAEVWLRKDPTRSASGPAGLLLRTTTGEPFVDVEKRFRGVGVPDDTWRIASTTLVVTERADGLRLSVSADADGDGCFLMDDVVLVRTK